jgi:hypothetical protein
MSYSWNEVSNAPLGGLLGISQTMYRVSLSLMSGLFHKATAEQQAPVVRQVKSNSTFSAVRHVSCMVSQL